MRKKALTIAFVVWFAGSAVSMLLFSFPSASSDDLLVLPFAAQDIGEVRQGKSVDVDFELRNQTSKPIQLLGVGTSCGCASSDFSQKEIKRGEGTVLTLNLDSGQSRGGVAVYAVVMYRREGEDRPRSTKLQVRVRVDPDYGCKPERLEFDESRPSVRQVVLRPRHIPTLKVIKTACDKRFFAAKLIVSDDPRQQTVEVAFDPEEYYADAGRAHLVIHTDSERQPILMVPLEVVKARG